MCLPETLNIIIGQKLGLNPPPWSQTLMTTRVFKLVRHFAGLQSLLHTLQQAYQVLIMKCWPRQKKGWFISSWNFKSGSISGAGSFIGTCGCRYSHLLLPCLLCWFSSQSYSLNSQKESITISFQYNSPYLNFVLIQKRTQTELDWSATRRGQIPGRESNLTLSQRPHAPRRDGPVLFLDIHRVILVCIAFSSSDAR